MLDKFEQTLVFVEVHYQEFLCLFDVVSLESDLKYPTINWRKMLFRLNIL